MFIVYLIHQILTQPESNGRPPILQTQGPGSSAEQASFGLCILKTANFYSMTYDLRWPYTATAVLLFCTLPPIAAPQAFA